MYILNVAILWRQNMCLEIYYNLLYYAYRSLRRHVRVWAAAEAQATGGRAHGLTRERVPAERVVLSQQRVQPAQRAPAVLTVHRWCCKTEMLLVKYVII